MDNADTVAYAPRNVAGFVNKHFVKTEHLHRRFDESGIGAFFVGIAAGANAFAIKSNEAVCFSRRKTKSHVGVLKNSGRMSEFRSKQRGDS